MPKAKSVFVCQSCGQKSPKWLGKCPACEEWNTITEELEVDGKSGSAGDIRFEHAPSKPLPINQLSFQEEPRIEVEISELNRVLGGGCVPGSVVLLGGDPGIGKSTLILQTLNAFAKKGLKTLYVSGEESAQQIWLRAKRIHAHCDNLIVLTETSLEKILDVIAEMKPSVLCLDSVQTINSNQLEAAAGTVSQVRLVSAKIVDFAKKSNCITFLIGHVTKEGSIAGPRVLEHMVDTVLYFETNQGQNFRILRATKNRFGSTNEMAVFEMTAEGLIDVANPSEVFLSERASDAPGSVVTVTLEGSRPILVELQSLTLPCHGGPPRRTCLGADSNRISLLAAVIQRELKVSLSDHDLYLNVVGGIKMTEPSADLGLIASMTSARLQAPANPQTVFFGEVGLTGEVRSIPQSGLRVEEARKLGFQTCVFPKSCLSRLRKELKHLPNPVDLKLIGIQHIRELLPLLNRDIKRPHPSPSLST